MTDDLEKALHRALLPRSPGEDFDARVVARLDSSATPSASASASASASVRLGDFMRHHEVRSRWLPAALAACLIAGIGLVQVRQHSAAAARADRARAQLLQALSIASDNVNIVRAAVAREENPDS